MIAPRGLLDIRTFLIARTVMMTTIEALQEIGSDGYEGFVLWSGKQEDASRFRFTSAHIPTQFPSRTSTGLMVYVDGEALFTVNKAAYEAGETLAGQVHTHPGRAYHSELDDRLPLVTLVGSLSLVVPDFARYAPADHDYWAWYQLSSDARWTPLQSHTEIVLE